MTQTITVAATDCYALAAQYLGDPNQFYRILAQNLALLKIEGFVDPVIYGTPIDIVIPDMESTPTGGIPTL